MATRGVRGATTVDTNTKDSIVKATKELLSEMIDANHIDPDDAAYAYFTTTHDLNAEFPAVAARQMGWEHVPLLCGHEMNVPDALPKCLRILVLLNTNKKPQEIVHVYLKGAKNLRARGMEQQASR